MDIILKNSSDAPIYQQIIDQIKAHIIEGKLTAGDALPSMRSLNVKAISKILQARAVL